jgi:hypothetical protein
MCMALQVFFRAFHWQVLVPDRQKFVNARRVWSFVRCLSMLGKNYHVRQYFRLEAGVIFLDMQVLVGAGRVLSLSYRCLSF